MDKVETVSQVIGGTDLETGVEPMDRVRLFHAAIVKRQSRMGHDYDVILNATTGAWGVMLTVDGKPFVLLIDELRFLSWHFASVAPTLSGAGRDSSEGLSAMLTHAADAAQEEAVRCALAEKE